MGSFSEIKGRKENKTKRWSMENKLIADIKIKRTLHWFFVCYHCGLWYFSKKRIKQKKCVRCNRTFTFNKSLKFKKECSNQEAILIVKKLKEREFNE